MKSPKHTLARLLALAAALAAVAVLDSCSTTRRLGEGELLYTGVKKIEYAPDSASRVGSGLKSAIGEAVMVAPNNYIKMFNWRYPFPLGLWVYNNWPNPEKGFRHWLYEKLVEEPVLVSDVRPEVRTRMIDQILDNHGYFRGTASYELVPGKNPRKASVVYRVDPGSPYRFRSVELLPDTTALNRLIDSIAAREPYLRAGAQYNTDSLSAVRIAITNKVRNRGYYFFTPDLIEYLADSAAHPGEIDLRLVLGSNLPRRIIEPYRVGDVTINVYRHNRGRYIGVDTVDTRVGTLIKQLPVRLRQSVITDNVTFRQGRLFSVRDMDRTQSNLSRLGVFSSVNIEAIPDTASSERLLDVRISATMDQPLEASIEVNASSKSNSYIGPGLSMGVTNRNIFGGGEQLSVKLNGAYEWQTGHNNRGGIFNSYEVGITGSLAFPRLLAPRFIPRRRRNLNWTRFSLNADLLNRPHFFKMAQFNASMAYDWQSTRNTSMSFTPFKLTYTKLMKTTADFDSIMDANPAVAQSFMSQFIPQMQYNYTYDRMFGPDNSVNVTFTAQEAGNIFWGIYEACGKRGEKELFGTPFSQFVKGQAQIVYGRRTGPADSWLFARAYVGAAHAYGNSSQVPYSEQFYCGGANSVRAFTVRSLGPGSYHAPADAPTDYFDQTGTFKFEANLEYRFPIVGPLHGAIFLDSGNVWLLKEDPSRPGGMLKASNFFKDLALGTGVGLRFDISMLVIRGDLGYALHAPYHTGKSGYFNMYFKDSFAFHLAIGYPF